MASLLSILDIAITVLVPAGVWTLLGVGLFQLFHESIRGPKVHHRVAQSTQS